MDDTGIEFVVDIPEPFRHEVALLYDEAFGAKFGVAVASRERRVELLSKSFLLPFGIAAIQQGRLFGIAGFQSR